MDEQFKEVSVTEDEIRAAIRHIDNLAGVLVSCCYYLIFFLGMRAQIYQLLLSLSLSLLLLLLLLQVQLALRGITYYYHRLTQMLFESYLLCFILGRSLYI